MFLLANFVNLGVLNPKNFGTNFFDHVFSSHFEFQNRRHGKRIRLWGHVLGLCAPKLILTNFNEFGMLNPNIVGSKCYKHTLNHHFKFQNGHHNE